MQSFTITRPNMTLDLLLFQAYGAAGQALLEQTLVLNPALADLGPMIPLGTTVNIPDRPASDPFRARPVVTLFG
jgi:phage tail protein X